MVDLSKMTQKELKKEVQRISKIAKSRIKNIEKNNEVSPAYNYLDKKYGKDIFKVKNKSRNELLSNVIKINEFLNKKTSTVSGIKEVKKAFEKRLPKIAKETQENKLRFWDIYRKFEEGYYGIINSKEYGSEYVQNLIQDYFENNVEKLLQLSDDEIIEKVADYFK